MSAPVLTANARTVLEKRYLWRDPSGSLIETPRELFARVARAVASVEARPKLWEKRFFELMTSLRFLPNTPTLINAGKKKGQLSACFVLPVEDSLDGIFESLKGAAKIHQSGGGTGFSFSRLRPSGSVVHSTRGISSGPVSFIKIYDVTTETIKQGGARRGANMAVLRVDHPDIEEFIDSKRDMRSILNFNISVGVTDEFMLALRDGKPFSLRDPETRADVRQVPARVLWEKITQSAWECGDPGVVFLDRINRFNPTPKVGEMESTNPCVTGDARLWIEGEGFLPIREAVGRTIGISTESVSGQGFHRASRVVLTGIKPVFRLRTFEGYELRLTADHRVTTDLGDIEAGALVGGERLRLLEAPEREVARDSAEARWGEVAGWLVGDGHFTHHGKDRMTAVLSFYGDDKREAAPRLLRTIRDRIQDAELQLNSVGSRGLLYIRSQRLLAELAAQGIGPSCKESVPECVWRAGAELQAGYLRGLFSADGGVQGTLKKGLSVRLASVSLPLLRDVQALLLGLGIKSVLYSDRRVAGKRWMPDAQGEPREYECQAQHEIVISKGSLVRFARQVGFVIQRKQDALEEAIAGYRRGPYAESFFATFKELVAEGEEEVFDLTEPETSHFHANGFLVHNCGEQPLLPYESCNLGSLNLGAYFVSGDFDWKAYRDDIHAATRFLDNVIDLNVFPLPESRKITQRNRKIGLGVMGLADLLLMLGIRYDSEEARDWGERLMSTLDREAKLASRKLAKERGAFPNWRGSLWDRLGYAPMRNATVSTVAPTGTISIIAGCSSGIEPIFAGIFYRNVLNGERLHDFHPAVERALRDQGHDPTEMNEADFERLLGPGWNPAADVSLEGHVGMQARFQRFSDSSVSKTINLPSAATRQDVAAAYETAYAQGCKGITVYRDRSRPVQVLDRPEPPPGTAPACPSC